MAVLAAATCLIPYWSLPAVDEVKQGQQVADVGASDDDDEDEDDEDESDSDEDEMDVPGAVSGGTATAATRLPQNAEDDEGDEEDDDDEGEEDDDDDEIDEGDEDVSEDSEAEDEEDESDEGEDDDDENAATGNKRKLPIAAAVVPTKKPKTDTSTTGFACSLYLIFFHFAADNGRNSEATEAVWRPHTHTHSFNGPFSRTTRVGRYQKGKTNLDFTEARDSEWQWHQLGICKSAPRSRQITTPAPHHSIFYRPGALPATQPTASKH